MTNELKYLRILGVMLSEEEQTLSKLKKISWALIILGFVIAFTAQLYSVSDSQFNIHSAVYVLSGCLIGFGWCQNIALRSLPFILKHFDRQSIIERFNEIET